jgi:CRISPR-associated endoribonuclease Cas6
MPARPATGWRSGAEPTRSQACGRHLAALHLWQDAYADMTANSPTIPIGRYRLRFEAEESMGFPEYAGSAWRGAFGHALKRAVCVTREPECSACLLYRNCPYPYVFETPPPTGARKMRRYPAAPHPYVLLPDTEGERHLDQGAQTALGLTLVGHANRLLAYFVHAFATAGEQGLGKGRGRLALVRVEQEPLPGGGAWATIMEQGDRLEPLAPLNPEPPCVPASVSVHLLTRLRLQYKERYVAPEDLSFSALFGALLRRLSMLSYFHTDTPLETDFAGLTAKAREIGVIDADVHWSDWTRYSSRQKRTMELGGLLGKFALAGDLTPFWPYLWLGQFVHAGKNASMGLGGYTLHTS